MTFCVGSLASNHNNDVYKIFKIFSEKINFIHLRNVIKEKDKKSFFESGHLDGDVDFVKLIKMILNEENKRKKKNKNFHIPMRPDHGHCLLDDQKKKICDICVEANADFVKTSTGFSSSGADLTDISNMRSWLPDSMQIKASGGIRNLEQALAFLDAGADRLGMSAGVAIMKEISEKA